MRARGPWVPFMPSQLFRVTVTKQQNTSRFFINGIKDRKHNAVFIFQNFGPFPSRRKPRCFQAHSRLLRISPISPNYRPPRIKFQREIFRETQKISEPMKSESTLDASIFQTKDSRTQKGLLASWVPRLAAWRDVSARWPSTVLAWDRASAV